MELSHKQRENIGVAFILDEMHPCSAWGRELLRNLAPYVPAQQAELQQELDNVKKTLDCWNQYLKEFKRLEHLFMQVKDIRASIRRCTNGTLSEVELFEVKRYLIQLSEIMPLYKAINRTAGYHAMPFAETRVALALLDPDRTGVATFHISERWSAELAAVRREKKDVELRLRERIVIVPTTADENGEPRPMTGDEILEATAKVREELEALRRRVVVREQVEEEKVRASLSVQLQEFVPAMLECATAIARLDVCIQKARLVHNYGGSMPAIGSPAIEMHGMYNPMVAAQLVGAGKQFTPVSISLCPGTTVITGANMGGKSITLKTLALNIYLALCGFYAFAESCSTPMLAEMHMVSDDLEDTSRGLSSFGGEIVRLNEIDAVLGNEPCLVLLDEFARGTNPHEGAAIAQGVCRYLNTKPGFTVMTTHFDHVTDAASAHYEVVGLKNADIAGLAATLRATPLKDRVALIAGQMDYGLLPVQAGAKMPQEALNICRLLGLNDKIVAEVEKKLLTFNSNRIE